MAKINTDSIEYHAAVLFVQAVAEDGVLSQDEATAVEGALEGFLEGMESDVKAIDCLNHIANAISNDRDGYRESVKDAIEYLADQKKELKSGMLDLMKDLAGVDGVSEKENKFFNLLKPKWNL